MFIKLRLKIGSSSIPEKLKVALLGRMVIGQPAKYDIANSSLTQPLIAHSRSRSVPSVNTQQALTMGTFLEEWP